MSRVGEQMPDDVWYGTDLKQSDIPRLETDYDRVVNLMLGEKFWTWKELAQELNLMDSSVSRYYRYVSKKDPGLIREKRILETGFSNTD